MFSQYSWGDFFKVVIPIIVLYYGYVVLKYYREDIRDWISNRDRPDSAVPDSVDEDVEPELAPSFLVTNDYRDQSVSTLAATNQDDQDDLEENPADYAPAGINPRQDALPIPPLSLTNHHEIVISGPDMGEQPEDHLALSMLGLPAENLLEQPLDVVIGVAQRITAEPDGVLVAIDQDDQPAAVLAAVINNQRARDAFADMSFTR